MLNMKRLVLLSLLLFPIFLFAQYPTFSNKQKLGVQTTGDGLIFRGTTVGNIPNYIPSNVNNAYFHLDTTNSKLYLYNDGWQQVYPAPQFDTTTLNVYLKISDTTAMLLPYFRDSDTTSLNLINRFALKLNISDTSVMLSPYLRKADTISLSNRINLKLNISDTTILSNRITTNANNIITINTKLNTKLDTIYVKFKNVVTRVLNKDTINIGSSLIDGYAINIIGDSINIDTTILDIRYPDRDSTNELQDITFATTSGVVTISGGKVMNLDTLYDSVIDSVKNLIQDSIAAFIPVTEGYGINIIGDSINVDTTIIFTQSDTITLSNRIDLKLNKSDTASLSNRIDIKLNKTDTLNLSNRIDLKLNKSDTVSLSDRINTKLNINDTISLSNRINKKLDTLYVNYQTSIDTIVNKDTINITTLEAGAGINIVNNVISLDTVLLDSVVRVQNVYVKNGTGTVLNKGEAVYVTGANGTNIIVGRASNVAESTSSKTLGLTMTSIGVNGFGYVIKEGLLAGLNTNSATAGDPIWLGVDGGLIFGLANKPYAPKHLVYLGVVTRKQQNNGEVYVTVQNGFEIKELHDVQIIDPVNKASLYYNSSESLWRDTTATLLVSDTASMLNPYLRKLDTLSLSNRINLKFNTTDTSTLGYVTTYSNQLNINGDKTFNNVITIDSATVTGKLLVNTNISDAVKINSNTNSTNLELMNSGGSVYIKSSNKNMTLQTDTTALVYLKGDVNKVGILTMNPQQALEVAGTIRVDSLSNNLIPTKLVGASTSNDLTNVALGTGLSFINDTLKIADNIINSGDTATLLRKDYLGINSNVLVWTEGNKKLLPYFTQVYRNGQLLKYENQYTITSDSILTLAVGSFRLKDNITIIAIDNIVALAGSGGFISLQGNVSGSGTNTINTTINNGVVTNTMLAGGISNDKLDVISTAGKVNNSATTATSNNTTNAIVSRNASGDFTAGTITASLNGNANTATTLATGRTISITGDLTYTSPTFNGSTNITAVGTLANSGVTANTYNSATITVDSKGRITSATSNTIPTVNDATLTLAVSGNGLTGSQSFTANQSSPATFTVTSNATNANTPSTIVFRDASGDFSSRNITASNFYGLASIATIANTIQSSTTTGTIRLATPSNAVTPTITVPDVNATIATTNLSQTFGGTQTFSNQIIGSISGSASSVTNTLTISAPLTGTSYNGSSSTSIGISAATTLAAGSMSAADKTKLDGIAAGATANTGTVTSVSGTGTVSGLTLTGTVTTTGNLTLGGTLSLTSGNVTSALGFTPYNATNPSGYITSSALTPYATLASPTFTGTVSGITKTMVGLSNVENTTDANKPISTATQTALDLKQNTLTNPVTGTGTINYIPKFTATGSTIGNSTLIDNGTTISTASTLSTTNYASLDAGNNTHRFTNTLSGNQTWTPSAGFITSYFSNNVSGGWYYNTSVDNSGFPILSILSTSNDRKKTGITLNSQGTANGTYSPAITFSSLSNSTAYYSAYAAIIGKKTGVGGYSGSDNNWNTGHIEFYGTTQATDVNGGVMLNSPSMTIGIGVGVGYDAPPTIKGRLIVSEKIGINQSTPNFTLDVGGTLNTTGAATINNVLTINSGASNGLLLNGTSDQNIKIYSSNLNGNAGIFYQNATTGQTQGIDGLFVGIIGQIGSYFINSENTKSYLYTNSNSNQLVLDTDGNVGVGIDDATNKLDINGTLRVRTTNTVTPSTILGRDNNGVVAGVIVGSGLNLTSGTLSLASGGGFITTNNDYTVTITDTWIVFNNNFSNITVTLPDATTSLGRTLYFRNAAAGSIVSAGTANIINNNVTTGPRTNDILGAGNTSVKWCTLVSNGTYWIKMQTGSF